MSDITKLVTTRLKLDGEHEYNSKLKNISKEMGLLRAEMSKSSAEFAGQSNSYAALTSKGHILEKQLIELEKRNRVTSDAVKEAKLAYAKYAQGVESAKKALEEEAKASSESSEKYKELEKVLSSQEEKLAKANNTMHISIIITDGIEHK